MNSQSVLNHSFTVITVLLLSCFLAACGFQLRQLPPTPIPLQTLLFTSNSAMVNFDRYLLNELAQAKITIIQKREIASTLELKILKIDASDIVLSTATDNDATSISRTLKVTYFIRKQDGKSLYGPRFIHVNEVLYSQEADSGLVGASNAAQLKLMQRELAKTLVNDLLYAPL